VGWIHRFSVPIHCSNGNLEGGDEESSGRKTCSGTFAKKGIQRQIDALPPTSFYGRLPADLLNTDSFDVEEACNGEMPSAIESFSNECEVHD